jgi:hypothetical protein
MKELLKSKIMIGFIIFVLGITYIDSVNVKKMEEDTKVAHDNLIVMNIK